MVLWVFSWLSMKSAMAYIGPFDFVVLRYALGTVPLFVAAWLTGERLWMPAWRPVVLTGLLQTGACQCLVQLALVSGGAGKTSMILYTMPFWIVVLAWWLHGQRPARRHWQAMAVAGVGLLCIIEPWQGLGSASGAVLTLGAGFCWAWGTLTAKRMFEQHQPGVLAFAAWQMLFGVLAALPVAWLVPQMTPVWSAALVLNLAYVVLAATSLGWWLWLTALRTLPAAVTTLSGLGVPLGVVLTAWAVLGERPTPSVWLGVALVLGGLVWINLPAARGRR
ncbi:EamA family transporter [Orrella sp. JC864]|uniref:DMT family transporter n=1 Tax=Orrella sp. JC864 TaxID=3120298 RepID=UPI00300A0C00